MKAERKKDSRIISYSLEQIAPEKAGILLSQGIGPGVEVPSLVNDLYHRAENIFSKLARPTGIIAGITLAEFLSIFQGEGLNAEDTPLQHIVPQASDLALFAFTLGKEMDQGIKRALDEGDLALGYMLDSMASFCTDKASRRTEEHYLKELLKNDRVDESTQVLNYSPGYCGWHISGQQKLFEVLQPEQIGITLNDSYLMVPLKSISGVMVAGDKKIHIFKNNYPFCEECKNYSCRHRIQSLK